MKNIKKADEVISAYLTMTMLSTFAIIIIGVPILFGCTVCGGLNLYLGAGIYFLAIATPFIILGLKYVEAINSEIEVESKNNDYLYSITTIPSPQIRNHNHLISVSKDARDMIIDV